MKLEGQDSSGRARPVSIDNSEFDLAIDLVIMALGTNPNPLIANTTSNLDLDNKNRIITVNEKGKTSKEGVFAGGDTVTGSATVILAMGAGKDAAKEIDQYIKKQERILA